MVRALDLATLRTLLPYLWPVGRRDLRARVVLSLCCLLVAITLTTLTPLLFARATDVLAETPTDVAMGAVLTTIGSYAISRILTALFAQLRDGIFGRVQYHAMQDVAVSTFEHLHALSLRFHLDRKMGSLSRIIERGVKGIDTLLSIILFNVLPTLLQIVLFGTEMVITLSAPIAAVALVMVVAYVAFTFTITRWRMGHRTELNKSDQEANTRAVDSLVNYETVKYFGNEAHESRRYDESMGRFADASVTAQTSLALLNFGQGTIMAVGTGIVLAMTAHRIETGALTIGAFSLALGILTQIYQPLNVLGTVYRQITQAVIDMEAMFGLRRRALEVEDRPGATELVVRGGAVAFEDVRFSYDPDREILHGLSFEVPAGKTLAIVGPSGAGKSTLSRLMFRFYDVTSGRITIDGTDIREVTQASLRRAIGIVPQDTVLFNDTLGYNIAYGRWGAPQSEIVEAARQAQLAPLVERLPQGYETRVGERGLKLSGGEKQRVAIARTMLKNPAILVLDEATSALDTTTEREIQASLEEIAQDRTTLVIAHRLSTVVDADEILFLDQGDVVERGTHAELLAKNGRYAAMWNEQREKSARAVGSPPLAIREA